MRSVLESEKQDSESAFLNYLPTKYCSITIPATIAHVSSDFHEKLNDYK